MKKNKFLIFMICSLICFAFSSKRAYASDGEEYITISVDAIDNNGSLKYALDTDDPAAFTDSNEFTVPAGTSHTIYVKDVAGNITSQVYTPDSSNETSIAHDEDEQKINIDLEIGGKNEKDYENYEYLTDDPIAPGTGTVAEKIKTDGSDDAEKVFYTFTTKEGNVLYMVIDQGQSADNVYLLDTVSISDLKVLASGNENSTASEKKEDNLLEALSKESESDAGEKDNKASNSSNSNLLLILIGVVIFGGLYYYFKIYKNKKDEAMDVIDAMDMDEFEPEEQEDEELEFEINDAEKEQYLDDLLNEDENLFDADPEEYAMSHMEEENNMEPDEMDNEFYEEMEDLDYGNIE